MYTSKKGTTSTPARLLTATIRWVGQVALVFMFVGGLVACGDDDPVSEEPTEPDPPTVTDAIDAQAMKADDDARAFELAEVFDDPSGEGLDYSAESSDAAVVEASVSATELTINPVDGGEATITVAAENDGGSADTSFDVEVILPDPPDQPD